jgi:hypothetical protein
LNPPLAELITADLVASLVSFILASATILAIPVSLFLLARYRRAVAREMSRAGADAPVVAEHRVGEQTLAPSSPLTIRVVDSRQPSADGAGAAPFFAQIRRRTRASAWVYSIAGAAFAAVMTYGWLVVTKDDGRPATKIAVLFWAYFWPTALAIALVIATSRAARLRTLGAYALVECAVAVWVLSRNPDSSPWQLAMYWLMVAAPPTLMLGAVMFARVRAVGPLVLPLVALVMAGVVSLAIVLWIGAEGRGVLADSIGLLPQDTQPVFWLLVSSAAALPPLLGWRRLSATAHRYQRRELSDEGLQIDSIFLFFAVVQSLSLVRSMPLGLLAGVFALAAHRVVVSLGMRASRSPAAGSSPVSLLLLRVFALGRRSERLFAALQRVWLRQGSMAMIAGSDLAASTLEPHEVVQFMLGQLPQQFVGNAAQLDERFRSMDRVALPDGRYRINEFYCHSNVWQRVMQRLVAESDVVLMDLRAFTRANQGCVFELAQLIDSIDLRRILFVIDQSTDRGFLEDTLTELWCRSRAESPNRAWPAPTATLFHCEAGAERTLDALLRQLLAFTEEARDSADDRKHYGASAGMHEDRKIP